MPLPDLTSDCLKIDLVLTVIIPTCPFTNWLLFKGMMSPPFLFMGPPGTCLHGSVPQLRPCPFSLGSATLSSLKEIAGLSAYLDAVLLKGCGKSKSVHERVNPQEHLYAMLCFVRFLFFFFFNLAGQLDHISKKLSPLTQLHFQFKL